MILGFWGKRIYVLSPFSTVAAWRSFSLQCAVNEKNANQGSLRDETLREQLPDRQTAVSVHAHIVCVLMNSWSAEYTQDQSNEAHHLGEKRGQKQILRTAIYWSESAPELLGGIISFIVKINLCERNSHSFVHSFLITSLAVTASQVCVH